MKPGGVEADLQVRRPSAEFDLVWITPWIRFEGRRITDIINVFVRRDEDRFSLRNPELLERMELWRMKIVGNCIRVSLPADEETRRESRDYITGLLETENPQRYLDDHPILERLCREVPLLPIFLLYMGRSEKGYQKDRPLIELYLFALVQSLDKVRKKAV